MDYATTDNGAATTSPKQKAKAAAPKRRAIPAVPLQKERQRSRTCRPPAICPAGAAAYGFLKIRFLPHFSGQVFTGSAAEKESFYRSFALLCDHYGIAPVATQNLAYPYGREVALHEAARLLRSKCAEQVTVSFEENDRDFVVTANECFNTANTLFYIPVLPLYYLLKDRQRKKAARLLLCVFAYLYRKAHVPYYTEDDSYLCWNYDRIAEWVSYEPEEYEPEEYNGNLSEIRTALYFGEVMRRRLWNPIHVERFSDWLAAFTPADAFGRECHRLAWKFYALWQDYPKACIYDHANASCFPDPESDDYDDYNDYECITMEKYISFVASTDGWLYERVEEAVNIDFNECSQMQEPVLQRCFDGHPQSPDSLGYECRLFPLINELCYLLNNCEYDT